MVSILFVAHRIEKDEGKVPIMGFLCDGPKYTQCVIAICFMLP